MEKREISMEEKVLRGLLACGTGTWETCQKCPYQGLDSKFDECWEKLCADAAVVMKRQALCVKILDRALDESAVALGKLSDQVAQLEREAEKHKRCYIPTEEAARLGRGAKETEPKGQEASEKLYFSAEEVRCMTIEEVGVHREVILKSMKFWSEGPKKPPSGRGDGFLGRVDI